MFLWVHKGLLIQDEKEATRVPLRVFLTKKRMLICHWEHKSQSQAVNTLLIKQDS